MQEGGKARVQGLVQIHVWVTSYPSCDQFNVNPFVCARGLYCGNAYRDNPGNLVVSKR